MWERTNPRHLKWENQILYCQLSVWVTGQCFLLVQACGHSMRRLLKFCLIHLERRKTSSPARKDSRAAVCSSLHAALLTHLHSRGHHLQVPCSLIFTFGSWRQIAGVGFCFYHNYKDLERFLKTKSDYSDWSIPGLISDVSQLLYCEFLDN